MSSSRSEEEGLIFQQKGYPQLAAIRAASAICGIYSSFFTTAHKVIQFREAQLIDSEQQILKLEHKLGDAASDWNKVFDCENEKGKEYCELLDGADHQLERYYENFVRLGKMLDRANPPASEINMYQIQLAIHQLDDLDIVGKRDTEPPLDGLISVMARREHDPLTKFIMKHFKYFENLYNWTPFRFLNRGNAYAINKVIRFSTVSRFVTTVVDIVALGLTIGVFFMLNYSKNSMQQLVFSIIWTICFLLFMRLSTGCSRSETVKALPAFAALLVVFFSKNSKY